MNCLRAVVLLVVSACTATRTVPPGSVCTAAPSSSVVLRGMIHNALPGDSVWVWLKLPQYTVRTKRATAIAADGTFRLKFTNVQAAFDAQLIHGLTVYLAPGDSLEMTADRRNFNETLRFSGSGAHANNYLMQAQRQFEYNLAGLPEKQHPTAHPSDFVRLVDAYRQRQLDTLAAWHARQALPTELLQLRQQVVDMQRGLSLLRYVCNQKSATKQEPILPAGYFNFLQKLPWPAEGQYACRPALLQTVAHLMGAYRYALLVNPAGQLSAAPGAAEQLYARVTADVGDNTLRDQMMSGLLVNQLFDFPEFSRTAVQATIPAFNAHNRDSASARNLREAWRTTAGLQPGQVAPDFALRNTQGQLVRLQDFQGKVVYLDFWYSSCQPCLAEAPAAAKLKKQFERRDVIFLYVSVDHKVSDWLHAISRFGLGSANSVHLLDPGAAQAASTYGVGSYPSYWIIGRNSRIVRASAPRPSVGAETMLALEKALAAQP